jgi:hypothetical protein
VLITQNFVGSRMPSPTHWSKSECCVPFRRYHEHKQFAGIGIGIVGKLCLCGKFGTNLMRCKIPRGVRRGFRVVGWALRVLLVTLPRVKSDLRIACQCRYREKCQVLSRRERKNARFGWINKKKWSDFPQTNISFIDQVLRYDRVSENEKVELWWYSPYNLEDSMDI